MIINMSEADINNIHDWSSYSPAIFRDILSINNGKIILKAEGQQLLLKLINLEMDDPRKIKSITFGADFEKQQRDLRRKYENYNL